MPTAQRSSHASEICRLEWRPSRLLAGALVLLGILAAFSVIASEMPRAAAWPLAIAALLHGIVLARAYRRKGARMLVWNGHVGKVLIDGLVVEGAEIAWRGPLAFVRYRSRSGHVGRLAWWPDTLPPSRRRELRLAAGFGSGGRGRASMAP